MTEMTLKILAAVGLTCLTILAVAACVHVWIMVLNGSDF